MYLTWMRDLDADLIAARQGSPPMGDRRDRAALLWVTGETEQPSYGWPVNGAQEPRGVAARAVSNIGADTGPVIRRR